MKDSRSTRRVTIEPLQTGNWYAIEYSVGVHRYGMAARVDEFITDDGPAVYIVTTPAPGGAIIPVLHQWITRARLLAPAYGYDMDADIALDKKKKKR